MSWKCFWFRNIQIIFISGQTKFVSVINKVQKGKSHSGLSKLARFFNMDCFKVLQLIGANKNTEKSKKII